MAIKRYLASKDTTITNAYKPGMLLRGTGSNMGLADSMEIFSIYGQQSATSSELSRGLIQFKDSVIQTDRTAGDIPASGSANFYLRLFNAKHPFTLPKSYTLGVHPVNASWEEGHGLDVDGYTHLTYDTEGASWLRRQAATSWTDIGGDYDHNRELFDTFDTGEEDLEIDITEWVEEWLAGSTVNNGLLLKLSGSQEASYTGSADGLQIINTTGSVTNYYTKKFFARGSEFWFKRPVIEARWDSSVLDDRGNFYSSHSAAPASYNDNTIYMYNYFGNNLVNIPDIGTGAIYVRLYEGEASGASLVSMVTGGYVSTGIYSATVALAATSSVIYDRWFNSAETVCYHTGTIDVKFAKPSNANPDRTYITNITNLKPNYHAHETARFRVYTRKKNWSPTLYKKARDHVSRNLVEVGYYRLKRVIDDCEVVAYGTGSTAHTKLSYDTSGSYFDFDMKMLEPGYMYEFDFVYDVNGRLEQQPERFKFRVKE